MPTNSEQMWTVERVEELLAKHPEVSDRVETANHILKLDSAIGFLLDSLTRARQDAAWWKSGLQTIVDDSPGDCRCDHSNENCCVRVRFYCPFCIAAVTLKGDSK